MISIQAFLEDLKPDGESKKKWIKKQMMKVILDVFLSNICNLLYIFHFVNVVQICSAHE